MVSRALSIFVQVDILRCSFDCDLMNMLCDGEDDDDEKKKRVRQFYSRIRSSSWLHMMILNDSCIFFAIVWFSVSMQALMKLSFYVNNSSMQWQWEVIQNSMRKYINSNNWIYLIKVQV